MMKTRTVSTKQVIKALRKMYHQVPNTYDDHRMDKKYHKDKFGDEICVSNPINDMMKRLMALADKNRTLYKAVHIQMNEYDIYNKRDTVKYLQDTVDYLYPKYRSGDISADLLAGYTGAMTDVLNNTDDDYFFILLDDDNNDDAVYALNIGTLQGVFQYIHEYYQEIGINFKL